MVLLLFLTSLLPAAGSPPGETEAYGYLLAAVDAGAAVMAGRLLCPPPRMAGVEVEPPQGGLPVAARFEEADLSLLIEALKPKAPSFADLVLGALLHPEKPADNPFAAICYKNLASKNRARGQYIFSGRIGFEYTKNLKSANDVLLRIFSGELGDEKVYAAVDLIVKGKAFGRGIPLEGRLALAMPNPGIVEIRLGEGFVLDNKKSGGGVIRYTIDPFAWRGI